MTETRGPGTDAAYQSRAAGDARVDPVGTDNAVTQDLIEPADTAQASGEVATTSRPASTARPSKGKRPSKGSKNGGGAKRNAPAQPITKKPAPGAVRTSAPASDAAGSTADAEGAATVDDALTDAHTGTHSEPTAMGRADLSDGALQLDHGADAAAGGSVDVPAAVPVSKRPKTKKKSAAASPDVSAPEAPASESPAPAAPAVPAAPAAEASERPAAAPSAVPADAPAALVARELVKTFGGVRAVDGIDLTVPAGSFYGIVGPNGAGKTTTLSMVSGLLRPDSGSITVGGMDAARKSRETKKLMGVLPDRFRTFDRLTGRQLLHYYGLLRGLPASVVESRAADLARAFDLTDALGRVVSDYSAGMTKKVMLAGALIHSPRVLVLDEPFESVDPVSSAVILEILRSYVAGGGTVILSSHGMDLVERVCSRVAVIVAGQVLAEGTIEEVRGDLTLEQRFVELSGGLSEVEGLEWLQTYSG